MNIYCIVSFVAGVVLAYACIWALGRAAAQADEAVRDAFEEYQRGR